MTNQNILWFKILFIAFVVYSLWHIQNQLEIANRKLTCQYNLSQNNSFGCDYEYIFFGGNPK